MRKILATALLLAAFFGSPTTVSAVEIGVVLTGNVLGIWQGITKGINQAAKDHHIDVIVRNPPDGSSLDTQKNIQLKLIDYMVHRGVGGIVLAAEPLEGVAVPISLSVPIVLVDRSSTDYIVASTVSIDNFAAGKAAALSLAPVLHKGAKIAVMRLWPTIKGTSAREEGFLSVAKEKGWDVVINTYVGYRFRESQEAMEKLLKGYGRPVDAIFTSGEPTSYSAMQIVAAMPANTRPRLVAFDWRSEFKPALEQGVFFSVMVPDAYQMGYVATETLLAAMQKRPSLPKLYVDVATVTSANVNDASIQKMLANYGWK
jgi:ribose transport system substrate-binding protein